MLIIPELEAVVITPPRTGSTALRRAVMQKYPNAFNPYRHMESDGIPNGYDRWRKYALVRNPFERLQSLYRYMGQVTIERASSAPLHWIERVNRCGALDFEDWLEDREVFSDPYDKDTFCPHYLTKRVMSITRKDLADYVFAEDHNITIGTIDQIAFDLDVNVKRVNATSGPAIEMTSFIADFLNQYHGDHYALFAAQQHQQHSTEIDI